MSARSRTVRVYDAAGLVLHEEPARSKAVRRSMRCSADQRQVEAAWQPGATRAVIDHGLTPPLVDMFTFDQRGRSSHVYPGLPWPDEKGSPS